MLESLLRRKEQLSNGVITGRLLDNQYRVTFNGLATVAISQAGVLSVGQAVTLASTAAGLVIISAGNATSTTSTEVTISG